MSSSLTIYSKLAATPNAVYVIGFSKSFSSFTLHVTSLHPSTGAVLTTKAIPSSITEPLSELLVLSLSNHNAQEAQSHHQGPHIIWLEQKVLKYVLLTPALDGKANALKGASIGKIMDIGLCGQHYFMAITADGTSKVMKIGRNAVKPVFEFEEVVSLASLLVLSFLLSRSCGIGN
jgi:ER membrane protein complex subunit 1